MPYFGKTGVIAATRTVDITGGYHVTIGLLSAKDQAECNAVLNSGQRAAKTKVVARGRPGSGEQGETEQTTELTLDMQAYRDAVLLKGIRAWDLDDDEGNVVPVDKAHIGQLLERDRNTVFVALDEFNAPLTDDDQRK